MSSAAKRVLTVLFIFIGTAGCGIGNSDFDVNGGVSASPTAGPGPAETADGSENSVNEAGATLEIVQIGNMTGRGSEFVLPYIRGVEDGIALLLATDRLDDEEWTLTSYDTEGSQEVALQVWDREIENSGTMVIFWWDYELLPAMIDTIAEFNGLVFVPHATVENLGPNGPANLFSLSAPLDFEFVYAISSLAANRGHLPALSESGILNVALLRWPDVFGNSALTTWSKDGLAAEEAAIVFEGTLMPSYTWDAAPDVRSAIRSEANVIYVQGYAHAPAIVVDELARQGELDNVIVIGPSQILDRDIFGYISSPDLFIGMLAPSHLVWWADGGNDSLDTMLARLTEAELSPAEFSRGRLIGALAVEILHEAMEVAITRNSGGQLGVNEIRIGLFGIDLRLDDGNLGNVSYAPSRRYPNQLQMRRVESFADFVIWP